MTEEPGGRRLDIVSHDFPGRAGMGREYDWDAASPKSAAMHRAVQTWRPEGAPGARQRNVTSQTPEITSIAPDILPHVRGVAGTPKSPK